VQDDVERRQQRVLSWGGDGCGGRSCGGASGRWPAERRRGGGAASVADAYGARDLATEARSEGDSAGGADGAGDRGTRMR
jgi:hypothetical protein